MELKGNQQVTVALESGEKVKGIVKRKSYLKGKLYRVGIKTDKGFIYLNLSPTL